MASVSKGFEEFSFIHIKLDDIMIRSTFKYNFKNLDNVSNRRTVKLELKFPSFVFQCAISHFDTIWKQTGMTEDRST